MTWIERTAYLQFRSGWQRDLSASVGFAHHDTAPRKYDPSNLVRDTMLGQGHQPNAGVALAGDCLEPVMHLIASVVTSKAGAWSR
ncbi:hypothetical protein [Microtetraspora malaysiensis]|uniref:hypothetical protein n=1 Tax=Microtetraspora malaysiensis TaxID=161358 RepID=UPI003D8BB50C